MRALDFARALRDLGFEVELQVSDRGPADESEVLHRSEFFPPRPPDRLRALGPVAGGAPFQTIPYRSSDLERAAIQRMNGMGPGDVVLVQLARHAPLLERLHRQRRASGPSLLVDLIDVLSLNFRRRAQIEGGARGLLWRAEARRLQQAERKMVARSDAVTVVCERDRGELIRLDGAARRKARTTRLPIAASVPEGEEREISGTRRRRLVFTGNLGYFVNDHAIRSFLERVWPRVRARRADLELVVAGARPGRPLRAACARAGAILRSDPPDLREILRGGDLALAPLVGGAGVPVKVLEAWSEGVPVVASDWCARGLLVEGETLSDVDDAVFRIRDPEGTDAESAEKFAALIVRALEDAEDARAHVRAGRARLERLHSFDAFRDAVGHFVQVAREGCGA